MSERRFRVGLTGGLATGKTPFNPSVTTILGDGGL